MLYIECLHYYISYYSNNIINKIILKIINMYDENGRFYLSSKDKATLLKCIYNNPYIPYKPFPKQAEMILANDIKPNDKLYVNNNGLVNNESGHDLKLLAMNKANIEDEDEFINTFRQIGDTTLQSDTKNCLDLRMGEYVQDPYTKIVNLEFEDENNILNQCNFITDADNNTYMEVPDVAILNTIRFLFGGDDKLYMEYSGCDEI